MLDKVGADAHQAMHTMDPRVTGANNARKHFKTSTRTRTNLDKKDICGNMRWLRCVVCITTDGTINSTYERVEGGMG